MYSVGANQLENQLHISTESPKEGFNDSFFQHFVDELKHKFKYFCVYVKYMRLLCYLLE